jgi:hypothetical protein
MTARSWCRLSALEAEASQRKVMAAAGDLDGKLSVTAYEGDLRPIDLDEDLPSA